ncbi:MAG: ribonuclease R [Planctomycetota bacterium]|jgi:ribonuclease R
MAEIYKERIIKFLRHPDYTPVKPARLAKALGVSSEDYEQFKLAFEQLRQAGHVVVGARNLISLPAMSGRLVGTFRANPKGFGFVTPLEPNSHGDLFIPPDVTAEAMTGDIVAAKVVKKGRRGGQMRYSGKVVEILQRAQNKFVGTLVKHPDGWIMQPDGTGFVEPISVDDVAAKNAREKDKVVVEIVSYPTEKHLARGVIVEVLGKAGRYDSEVNSIIRQYHLPEGFDESCVEQAREAAAGFSPEQLDERDDITEKVTVTIDPPDAKDFDDAISLEKDADGNWVLGVHIADVSFFVGLDSPLDAEARLRGNSVYLPEKTIPMLPEIVSNGICSLQPEQKRFVKSAYTTYDRDGNVLSRKFANSVMQSRQRLTYEQADKVLRGRTKGIKPEVVELLKDMEALSRAIEKRREKNGMLHLDLPETELVLDKSGRVVDAHPADDSYPHTIIEMFMVEANEAVASVLDRAGVRVMRRIHPEPDDLSLQNLAKLVRALGYSLPRRPGRASIQELLAGVKGTSSSLAVNIAVLRSFEKAQYAPLQVGHFALASACYCHFTSPIRRYADLLVHRALELYLQGRADLAKEIAAGQDLAGIGKHITFTEERAEDAEQELRTVLILQMLSKRVGEEIDCVVTGLAGFGVFVQSLKLGIDGLIQMGDLGPDRWRFDSRSQSVVGTNSGETVHLGQAIRARIVSVNVGARQLNLAPAEPLVATVKRGRKSKAPKTSRREQPRKRSRKGRPQRRSRGKR